MGDALWAAVEDRADRVLLGARCSQGPARPPLLVAGLLAPGGSAALRPEVAEVVAACGVSFHGEEMELVVAAPTRGEEAPLEHPATELDRFSAELSASLRGSMVKSCTWLWPLHDRAADAQIQKVATSHLVEDGVEIDSISVARRVLAKLFILVPPGGSLIVKMVRDVYGSRSAYAMFMGWFYAHQLWILAAIAAVALALQTCSIQLAGEVMNYGTLVWSCWLLWRVWSHSTILGFGDPIDGVGSSRVHDHLHSPGRPGVNSSCLNAVALAFLTVLFTLFVFSVTFGYVQMLAWFDFTWGACTTQECQSAGTKHTLLGVAIEISVAVGFALIMTLLRAVARWFGHWAATWHNFEFAIDRILVAKAYTQLVASVDTIGAFVLFGLLFVTPWPDAAGGDPAELADADCSDVLFYSVLGTNAFECVIRGVGLDRRRAVYRTMMRGPLMVTPFIRILTKCVLPMAARRLSGHRVHFMGTCRLLGDAFNVLKRLLVLAFAYDADSVGGLKFVLAGDPWEEASALAAADGEWLLDDALQEVRLKEFEPDDEVMEVKLSVLFVIMFAPIMPEGVFTTLLGRMVENWGDLAKLIFARRRPFPDHGTSVAAMHVEVRGFLASAVALKASWSLVLSFVVFSNE